MGSSAAPRQPRAPGHPDSPPAAQSARRRAGQPAAALTVTLVYFDSSALVKLVVDKEGSDLAAELRDGCDAALACRLAYPEVRAALAAACRNHDLTEADLDSAEQAWEEHWAAVRPVELTVAVALAIGDPDLTLAVWDRRLHAGAAAGRPVAPHTYPPLVEIRALAGLVTVDLVRASGVRGIRSITAADDIAGQTRTGSTFAVDSVAFSPSGQVLAADDDGMIRLWNLNVQYAIDRICAAVGGLAPQQWSQYIPHLRYQPSCGH